MNDKLIEALALLDPKDDSHWTQDGAPLVEMVQELVNSKDVKRSDIIAVAPELTRETALAALSNPTPEPSIEEDKGEVLERDALMARSEELGKAVSAKREDINRLTRDMQKLVDEQDEVLKQLDKQGASSHIENIHNIRAHLASQHAQRVARHAATAHLLKGVNAASLDPRSPLDKSMARKTGHGRARPDFSGRVAESKKA